MEAFAGPTPAVALKLLSFPLKQQMFPLLNVGRLDWRVLLAPPAFRKATDKSHFPGGGCWKREVAFAALGVVLRLGSLHTEAKKRAQLTLVLATKCH